jgi:hypothetical protein
MNWVNDAIIETGIYPNKANLRTIHGATESARGILSQRPLVA